MLALDLNDIRLGFPGLDGCALEIASLHLGAGAQMVISGASGSGKSSFINIISGLIRPGRGEVRWNGTDITRLSEAGRDRWRGQNIGLVMQEFHLFPGLSALENVLLPARLARSADRALQRRAQELLAEVGLPRPGQRIETMSRGEMQRVAVARALLRNPGVIIADEPTASLDAANGAAVAGLLRELATRSGASLIVVTHDPALIAGMPRHLVLSAGQVREDNMTEVN